MHGRDFGKRWVLYPEPIREPLLGWSGEAPREVKWGLAFSPELQSSATPCSRRWDVCRAWFVSSTAPANFHPRPRIKMIGGSEIVAAAIASLMTFSPGTRVLTPSST